MAQRVERHVAGRDTRPFNRPPEAARHGRIGLLRPWVRNAPRGRLRLRRQHGFHRRTDRIAPRAAILRPEKRQVVAPTLVPSEAQQLTDARGRDERQGHDRLKRRAVGPEQLPLLIDLQDLRAAVVDSEALHAPCWKTWVRPVGELPTVETDASLRAQTVA